MKREDKKKQQKFMEWRQVLVFALLGTCFGIFGIAGGGIFWEDNTLGEKLLSLPLLLFLLCFAIIIQVVVHEVGHLICGKISGYEYASFRIGSLMFVKKDGKIRCRRFSLMGTGGQCLMTPPEPYSSRIPFLLYNLGGSIGNLILSGIAVGVYLLIGQSPIVSVFLLTLAAMGILLALMNGIPMRLKEVNNDGYNAFYLVKHEAARRCFWIEMRVNGLTTAGVRLKNMPDQWFALPSCDEMHNSLCASVGALAFSRAVDNMDFEGAKKIGYDLLENAEGLAGIHKYFVELELIFFQLIAGACAEEIEEMFTKEFKKFLKASEKNPSVIRMLYAYDLLLKKDEQGARKRLVEFDKVARTYPHASQIEGERELLEYIKSLSSHLSFG